MTAPSVLAPWERKAHRVIHSLCFASWRDANTLRNGRRRKKAVAYSVPPLAAELVTALGIQDDTERERLIKSKLLHHAYMIVTKGHDATGVKA